MPSLHMLSVCIPIYNFDVRALVNELAAQIKTLKVLAEIVLIDDCSDEEFKAVNEDVCRQHAYHQLDANVGRAKIRNLFLDYAQYDYLLFLDCDATIISDNLLSQYIQVITENDYQVICGGSIYPKDKVSKAYALRWKNGNARETIPAQRRLQSPYSSFMTSNVLINKSVFDKVTFDETILTYGHEDTLFGYELKKRGIPIHHIDNAVLNDDLDINEVFIEKTEEALKNLAVIIERMDFDADFMSSIKILKVYSIINSLGLSSLISALFNIVKRPVKHTMSVGNTNLFLFDIYKLGVLLQALK